MYSLQQEVNYEYIYPQSRFSKVLDNRYVRGASIAVSMSVTVVGAIALSSVKVLTGAFGTSKFNTATNQVAEEIKQGITPILKWTAYLEAGFWALTFILFVVSGVDVISALVLSMIGFVYIMAIFSFWLTVFTSIEIVIDSLLRSIFS